jgi:myosin-9
MSFISSFKKALGFADDIDNEEDLDVSDAMPNHSENTAATETTTEDQILSDEKDDSLPGDIFDSIITLFNGIQPEFVSKCLSTDEQRKYILDHIDTSIRKRIETVMENARQRASRDNTEAQKKMQSELHRLREQNSAFEAKKDEYQSAQLSASRQKRALSERVHDLEAQVANLEAEKEQFQLENRSMANKLRVASVIGSDSEDAENKMLKLVEENTELQKRLESLTNEMAELKANPITPEPDNAALEEISRQVEKFEEIKKRKDAKITELKDELQANAANLAELQKELTASRIECDSLRKTIETNLYAQAKSEKELKDEIQSLTEKLDKLSKEATKSVAAPQYGATTPKRRSKKRPVISAIDDLMESTDWFVAQEPTPMKKDPEVEEDFGYKEPAKKINKDDDKQLSLF